MYHEIPAITEPESIISIDENGLAHSNSEGYVFAKARVTQCGLESDPAIITTGRVYGDPAVDQVIAVWPPDYTPDGYHLTYDEAMSANPDISTR